MKLNAILLILSLIVPGSLHSASASASETTPSCSARLEARIHRKGKKHSVNDGDRMAGAVVYGGVSGAVLGGGMGMLYWLVPSVGVSPGFIPGALSYPNAGTTLANTFKAFILVPFQSGLIAGVAVGAGIGLGIVIGHKSRVRHIKKILNLFDGAANGGNSSTASLWEKFSETLPGMTYPQFLAAIHQADIEGTACKTAHGFWNRLAPTQKGLVQVITPEDSESED